MINQTARLEDARIISEKDLPAFIGSVDPYRIDPSTFLSTFSLTAEQRRRLASQNDFCRAQEIGLLLYAHIYRETCRIRHVAILSSDADRGLQRQWEQNREALIAQAVDAFFGKCDAAGPELETLAARAVEVADQLRQASDAQWNAANDAAYDARHAFRLRFFAVTGLEPRRLNQLQRDGVL